MNDTDARRRNHWVSHIALLTRMAEAFPGVTNVAVFGQTEMSPVTCALSGEDALPRNASGKIMKTALRQEYR